MFDDILHKRLHTPYTLHFETLRAGKRPGTTYVMLHGIGSSTKMWHKTAQQMPDGVRVVAIDLLGFGKSPDPGWVKYDARTQARSIAATMLLHGVVFKSVIIGHSLGALVAVEIARRYPRLASTLVLVSPPIYKPSKGKIVATQKEDILRGVFKILYKNPAGTERALSLARKYYVRRTGASVSDTVNIDSFLGALEAAVINQSTIEHITRVNIPIHIISGSRDPLVVSGNLQRLARRNENIRHTVVKKAGHNVVGILADALPGLIADAVAA